MVASPSHARLPGRPGRAPSRVPDKPGLGTRASGVLMHLTSLPSAHGVGDLGPAAHRFASFLARAGQSFWQMLPVGPPGFGNSPYQALSAFAGNPLLISLEGLVADGLLRRQELVVSRPFARERVHYAKAWAFKEPRLRRAFSRLAKAPPALTDALEEYVQTHSSWLEDWALYAALKQAQDQIAWTDWDEALRLRRRAALRRAREALAEEIAFHTFLQFLFDRQWSALRDHCARLGIGLVGDIPIFAAHDSADVWAHPELFQLDPQGRPEVVAGVPPDYFSATGQLWGNPLYRWPRLRRTGYEWWVQRFRSMLARFDAIRVDHFIGFHRYWEVPAGALTAFEGRYRPGPGADFFEVMRAKLGDLPIIAEDLGVVIPEVKALRDRFGFPGMRILQFAFGDDPEADSYKPHNYPRHCVVYTGTHDNDTAVGWFRDKGSKSSTRSPEQIRREHAFALRYLGSDGKRIHLDLIRAAQASVADLAIVPMQDWLGLDSRARMNRPGTAGGNWEWRVLETALTDSLAERVAQMASDYGRLPTAPARPEERTWQPGRR